MEDDDAEVPQGEVPAGVGPEVFREHLRRMAGQDPEHGARIVLEEETVYLADIERVDEEPGGHRSRVTLRNGAIVAGLTGAAIAGALATIRFRRRHTR